MSTGQHYLFCLFLLAFFCLPNAYSSTTPAKDIANNSLFYFAADDVLKSDGISEGVYLHIKPIALDQIVNQKRQHLEIQIPLTVDSKLELELDRKQFFANGFNVVKQSGSEKSIADYNPGVYYHGKVKGWPNSLVAISFFENNIMGVISYNGENYNLGVLTDASKKEDDVYVLFPESNLLQVNEFVCHTPDLPMEIPANLGVSGIESVTTKSPKVYFQCDYDMYLDNGSNVAATTDFVTGMFNVVAAVYAIDDICVEIAEIFVWTTNDPYPNSSSDAALDAFQSQLNGSFNGDVAHLLSTASGGNGGLAYVDVLCGNSSWSIGYSNIDDGYNELPNYSWTVMVVAHELGHNFGSPHTHSCSWPGGAIDNCFCPEESCGFGPEPAASGGTIMSYCHLGGPGASGNCNIPTSNPGIDLSSGFGVNPAALIFSNIESAFCLTACNSGGGGSVLDCATAVELFNGVTYNGNTNQGNANVATYGCNDNDQSGNEVVHFFTAPVSGEATITYNENVAGEIDLFVLTSCNPNSCIQFYNGAAGVIETMSVNAGQTYYFIADVYQGGAGGAYDLTISFPDGACQCDNPLALSCDNLESYNTGFVGTQSVCWTTWSGVQGGLEEGLVSSDQAFSGSNALKIEGGSNGGPQDAVYLPGNYTSGHYQLSFKIYVPSGKAAYYNIQHVFVPGSTFEWASDVFFNTDGTGTLNAGTPNVAGFTYTQGSWIDVVQDIDIDNDQTILSIGGTTIHTWPFSYQNNSTSGGTNALAAIDFYPLDQTYLYYIDNVELIENGGASFMTISPGTQTVGSAAGNTSFNLSSNVNWSVTDDASWLTVTPSSSNGNASIIATFDENPTTSTRIATLSLSGGGLMQTATVVQEGAAQPFVTINPDNQNVGAPAGNTSFTVASNISWSLSDDASWLTLDASSTNGNASIVAIFDENQTTNSRVATITLTGSGLTQTATVSQAGMVLPPIVTTYSVINESCYNQADAGIDLTVVGGEPGYSYLWSNGVTTEDLTNVSGGIYSCTITDNNGQTQSTGDIELSPAPEITATIETPGTLSCAQSSLLISAINSNFDTGVSASWTTLDGNIVSGENTLTLAVDAPGTYTLTLMYNNDPNCTSTASVAVEQIPNLEGSISSTAETGQNADGTATVMASGGSPPYTYSWNTTPVQTGATAVGLSAGSYMAVVTDSNNCMIEISVEVGGITSTTELPGLEKFNLYPNPSTGQVNVLLNFEQAELADLNIYDVLGRKVWSKIIDAKEFQENIDLSNLPNSVYMVTLGKGGEQVTKRLLIYR